MCLCIMQFLRMARVMMTARRVDADEGGTYPSAQGTSAPVAERTSRKKTPTKGKIPSKKVDRSEDDSSENVAHALDYDWPTVDSHMLFGASTITRRDFEKYKDRGYLDDLERCRPGGSDITLCRRLMRLYYSKVSCCKGFGFR